MSTTTFPKEVKRDSLVVTIYETPTKGYPNYTLVYYLGKKRKRETCADYDVIRARADEVLDDLEAQRPDSIALKPIQRDDYARCVELVKPTGQPLTIAASHYAEAYKILGADLIVLAAQEYKSRHLDKVQPRIVSEAVIEFLAEKTAAKRSKRHLDTLTSHLERFGRYSLGPIAGVTTAEIDLFLSQLKGKDEKAVSIRTRENYANSIVSLFEWAKLKRYVAGDYDETARITRLDNDEDAAIEIYRPEEMAAMLATAKGNLAKLIPFLTIGGFAGLRSSEIMRLDWSEVRTENGTAHIVVTKGKVKMRGKSRRIVPMAENLKAWLATCSEKRGLVWPFNHQYLYECLGELTTKAEALLRETDSKAKLEWKSNALRHSCISYRVAQIKNVPQVALESGNSPQMIDSNYRELVTDEDAQKWFTISPAK